MGYYINKIPTITNVKHHHKTEQSHKSLDLRCCPTCPHGHLELTYLSPLTHTSGYARVSKLLYLFFWTTPVLWYSYVHAVVFNVLAIMRYCSAVWKQLSLCSQTGNQNAIIPCNGRFMYVDLPDIPICSLYTYK